MISSYQADSARVALLNRSNSFISYYSKVYHCMNLQRGGVDLTESSEALSALCFDDQKSRAQVGA